MIQGSFKGDQATVIDQVLMLVHLKRFVRSTRALSLTLAGFAVSERAK